MIDKKQGLSLDYLVNNGYVLIAPGKDSMTVLQNQFSPPADGSGGIKWEEESSTTTSGMGTTTNSNVNANANTNSITTEKNMNVNGQ